MPAASSEFSRQKVDVETRLAELPDNDKLLAFDRRLAIVWSLKDSMAVASREQLQELVALLVEASARAGLLLRYRTGVPLKRQGADRCRWEHARFEGSMEEIAGRVDSLVLTSDHLEIAVLHELGMPTDPALDSRYGVVPLVSGDA